MAGVGVRSEVGRLSPHRVRLRLRPAEKLNR